MVLLPMVARELQVASHQPRTWWRRVLAGGVATLILGLVYLSTYRWAAAPQMGRSLFEALTVFAFVFALLAGPLATCDCLSSERREGTLGLLFLTDLRSYDVVLGKLFAAALNVFFAFLAVFPLLALPLLLGGVAFTQFWLAALGLLNTFFLSLTLGLCLSSLCTSGRASTVLTASLMAFLTFGIPLIASGVFEIHPNDPLGPFVFCLCPLYTMVQVFDSGNRAGWPYWLNVGLIHAFSWLAVVLCCWFTARGWRDQPDSMARMNWRERWTRWSTGRRAARKEHRRRALDANPVFWLDDRFRLQKSLLWAALAGCALIYLADRLDRPDWTDSGDIMVFGLAVNYGLDLWIALQAPHRFAEDRHSGAFELLLCTPLTTREILSGRLRALQAQFGWPLRVVVLAELAMLGVYNFDQVRHQYWWRPAFNETTFASLLGIVLLPVQAYCLARVGLYLGLIHKSSITAAVGAAWRVVILPWLGMLLFVIAYDLLRIRFIGRISDYAAIAIWFLFQLTAGIGFAAVANWQLKHRFRELAARPMKTPWWWRLLRI